MRSGILCTILDEVLLERARRELGTTTKKVTIQEALRLAAEYGAIVVHYDRDFDLIADVGGPRSEWVAPPGLFDGRA